MAPVRKRLLEPIALDVQVVKPRTKLRRKRRQAANAKLEPVRLRLPERRRKPGELVRDHRSDHRTRDLERDGRLDADAAVVVRHADLPAREHFGPREDAILLEERDVALVLKRRERGHRVPEVREPSLRGFLRPCGGIAVAREDDALVRLYLVLEKLLQIRVEVALHPVEPVADRVDGLGHDCVEDHLALGAVLRRAGRAELELVARERERRRAVAVSRVLRKRGERVDAHAKRRLRRALRPLRAGLDGVQDGVQLIAEKHRDDCGRRLVRAKAVVVSGAGRRHAEDVRVHLYGADDREKDREEDGVFARVVAGREEVPAAVGDRPVAVLARSVHALERLFVQEAHKAVALRRLAQHLHYEHVVVDGEVEVLEHRRKLELRRRDLVVARLRRDAELPEALLDLGHELEDARLDRAEVVVFELLVLRGRRTEHRAPGLQEVRALHVETTVDEEILLLGSKSYLYMRLRLAELAHQPLDRLRDGLDRAEKRRLHVERVAGERAERRRYAQGRAVLVALHERGGSRIPCRVAARLEGGTEPARRERARVGLAANEVLPREPLHRLRGARRLEKRIVLLGRAARERLEPVGEVRRALLDRPVLHARSDCVGDRRIEGLPLPHRRKQLRRDPLRQKLADRLLGEDVFPVVLHDRVTHMVHSSTMSAERS